jgi:hypothetical protein
MSRSRVFLTAWLSATVPVAVAAALGVESFLRAISDFAIGWRAPSMVVYHGVFSLGAAALQALVMGLHRRPVDRWLGWTTAGQVGGACAFFALEAVWRQFIGRFGAVTLPAWYFWIYAGFAHFSAAFLAGFGEAVALWGLRTPARLVPWVGLRVVLALGAAGALLAFGVETLPVVVAPWDLHRYRALAALAQSGLAAVATVWMLDRVYFRIAPARP